MYLRKEDIFIDRINCLKFFYNVDETYDRGTEKGLGNIEMYAAY